MSTRIWYVVSPTPGDDDGYNVTRDGVFVTWHSSEAEAVIDAIAQAMQEQSDTGVQTGYRCTALDGRIRDERTYPRPPRVDTPG